VKKVKETFQTKTIVLKPQLTMEAVQKFVEGKKTDPFRSLLVKPDRSEVHVHYLTLSYEPHIILSGRYQADFYRKATHQIKVDWNVKEVVLGDGVFPVVKKSSVLQKLEGKRGKNRIDLELEEHVLVENKKKIILDRHGKESKFYYKIDAKNSENYPKRILQKNNVKKFEITMDAAVKKLHEKLKGEARDTDVRNLNEKISVDEIREIYVPIYEARLIGPKKKVKILRIDSVKKKVI